MVWGVECGVQDLGLTIKGSGFKTYNSGYVAWGSWVKKFGIQNVQFRVWSLGFMRQGVRDSGTLPSAREVWAKTGNISS